jgi:enoyl-CoA hydratase/carnithine racemase
MVSIFDEFDDNDELRVAIIDGAGRAFSSGADLREQTPAEEPERSQAQFAIRFFFERLERVRKPVIACLHGYTLGAGLEMALCCDVRFATEDALFGTPEPRTVRGAPVIAIHRLARVIPKGEALRIMYSSQPITARRAYDVGLIQECLPDKLAMMAAADDLADQIIQCDPNAIIDVKQAATWIHARDIVESQRYAESTGIGMQRSTPHPGAEYLARQAQHSQRQAKEAL